MGLARPLTLIVVAALPVACASLDGLSGGGPADGGADTKTSDGGRDAPRVDGTTHEASTREASTHEASTEASPVDGVAPDVVTRDDAGHDAGHVDGGHDAGTAWGTLGVVQSAANFGVPSLAFNTTTTAGTLLVSFQPHANPPSGAGWVKLATDTPGDAIYVWPDNPGGLKTFDPTGDAGAIDAILVEFRGTPHTISLDFETDTGPKAVASMLTVTGAVPAEHGELNLLYLDSNAATAADAGAGSGWHFIATDGNDNFAWWKASLATAPTATVTFAPASATCLMMACLKTP